MGTPEWVRSIAPGDTIEILRVGSTSEWVICIQGEDGHLEGGFETGEAAVERLTSLGLGDRF